MNFININLPLQDCTKIITALKNDPKTHRRLINKLRRSVENEKRGNLMQQRVTERYDIPVTPKSIAKHIIYTALLHNFQYIEQFLQTEKYFSKFTDHDKTEIRKHTDNYINQMRKVIYP